MWLHLAVHIKSGKNSSLTDEGWEAKKKFRASALPHTDLWQIKSKSWDRDCNSEGIWWLFHAVRGILLVWFGSTCPHGGMSHCRSIVCRLTCYCMMKHFYPGMSCLFPYGNSLIYRTCGVAKWFDLSHMLWPDLHSAEHLCGILDWFVRQRSRQPFQNIK